MKHISDKASRDSNFNAHFYTFEGCDSTYSDRLYTTNGVTSLFPIPVYIISDCSSTTEKVSCIRGYQSSIHCSRYLYGTCC